MPFSAKENLENAAVFERISAAKKETKLDSLVLAREFGIRKRDWDKMQVRFKAWKRRQRTLLEGDDLDAAESEDPMMVSRYVVEIYEHLRNVEV